MEELTWPDGPCSSTFCQLDDLARCPICHEFFTVPLSLSCGHAYCSACIRNNLEYQERQGRAKCPQCRHPCDTRDLRPCHPLKDLVEGYSRGRLLLIQAAHQTIPSDPSQPAAGRRTSGRLQKRQRSSQEAAEAAPQEQQKAAKSDRGARAGPSSRHTQDAGHASTKSASTFIDMTKEDSGRRLRSRSAASKGTHDAGPDASADSDIALSLSSDSSWGSEPPSQKPKRKSVSTAGKSTTAAAKAVPAVNHLPPGYVECPCCTMQLRATLLNDHLDKCLEKDSSDFQVQPRRLAPVSTAGKLEVPPKLVFSMLNNKDLQAKLRACRLPTDGKRQDWEQRYNRFRVEVQIAQDAGENVTLDELARRLTKKERQTAAVTFTGPRSKQAAPVVAGASSFEELISKTRERAAQKAVAAQPRTQPSLEPQQLPQAAAPDAQPLLSAWPSAAPEKPQPACSNGNVTPAVAHGGLIGRPGESPGSRRQEQEEASGEESRRFSGRPVDGNVQQEAAPRDGVPCKAATQVQPALPQHTGGGRCADGVEGIPFCAQASDKARSDSISMQVGDAEVLGTGLQCNMFTEEVPDSDLER